MAVKKRINSVKNSKRTRRKVVTRKGIVRSANRTVRKTKPIKRRIKTALKSRKTSAIKRRRSTPLRKHTNTSYQKGFDQSYREGYNSGFNVGIQEGHQYAYEQQG